MARRQRGSRGRRKGRQSNPTRNQWIAGGAIALGTIAVVTAVAMDQEPLRGRPLGPLPSPYPMTPEGAGVCDLGPSYPGFIFDGTACVPSEDTPAGIYVINDCSDFIFVGGDESGQIDDLENRVGAAVAASMQPGIGADPTNVVNGFLREFWPDCAWPPGADASARIEQLYIAMSLMASRMILIQGGRVLGTSDPDSADEHTVERLHALGITATYDPDIVPEIELPEVPEQDQGGGGGVIPPDPQPPGPGLIDFPDGGPAMPQGGGGTPDCEETPEHAAHVAYPPGVSWETEDSYEIEVFEIPLDEPCDRWRIDVGICMRPLGATFGQLVDYVEPPVDFGVSFFAIRRVDKADMVWSQFDAPLTWKKQFRFEVARVGNNWAKAVTPLAQHANAAVDPCPDRVGNWPLLSYFVKPVASGEKLWNAEPRISIALDKRKVFLRVRYSGMPQFIDHGWEAHLDRPTNYQIDSKIRTIGV